MHSLHSMRPPYQSRPGIAVLTTTSVLSSLSCKATGGKLSPALSAVIATMPLSCPHIFSPLFFGIATSPEYQWRWAKMLQKLRLD